MTVYIITFISVYISILLGIWVYRLKQQQYEIISINKDRQQYNESIEKDIESNTRQLESIKNVISTQNNVVQSLNATADNLRQEATKRAQEEYESKRKELLNKAEEAYNLAAANLNEQLSIVSAQVEEEIKKLNNLQAKQLAYIQAQQRQQEIDEKQDYYRLVVSDLELNDIKLLRELQTRFFKKEAIDKLIWEIYYKPAYDILMAHLFQNNSKVCGIYKITNLENGQAYIGQRVDIKERFRQHIKTSLQYGNATNKLYQQMQQFGQSNFTFEILESVERSQLNERETYWIEFYKSATYGMNSTKGNLN